MAKSMFEKQQDIAVLGEHLRSKTNELNDIIANASIPMSQITAKKQEVEEAQARYDIAKEQLDKEVAEEQAKLQQKVPIVLDEKSSKAKAKGDYYKAALTGGSASKVAQLAYQQLGAIPDGANGGGENFLPRNMENELIIEPMQDNPMREVIRITNITGLEEPKLLFEVDGETYEDVTDSDTAKEIEMEGSTVTYGRHKVKVKAKVSDTVLHGSSIALASTIDNALRSGLAVNEINRMFAKTPKTDYEGMSLYSSANKVKRIYKPTKQAAIAAALADLPMAFRRNARIVMSSVDWYDMWGENLNKSGMFYEERPLTLFGKPVVLVDDAIDPIVGDFTYMGLNYDIGTIYDTDKDVEKGVYLFVLTAWYDIKLRLKTAFRIAKVGNSPDITEFKTVATLPTTSISTDAVYVLTAIDGGKPEGSMWKHNGTTWVEYTA